MKGQWFGQYVSMADTLKIKDLPMDARPREAFMRSAAPERDIPDASLLAILIRTGRKGSSAIDLAHRLVNHFGSAANLVDATWQQIVAAKVPGGLMMPCFLFGGPCPPPEPPDASRQYEVLPGGAIRYLDNKDKTRKAK